LVLIGSPVFRDEGLAAPSAWAFAGLKIGYFCGGARKF